MPDYQGQKNRKMKPEYAKYRFDPKMLDKPRADGISGFMRIKNGEDFLQLAIESHIDFFDEIIACYNGCTDKTEQILHKMRKKYPQKIKIYHYEPKVYSVVSQEQQDFADGVSKIDEIHSMANYYNFALSKTTKKIATKLDDDHLAVRSSMAKAVQKVRQNGNKIYTFSGINLMRKNLEIGVAKNRAFCGVVDHWFIPVSSKTFFYNAPNYEVLDINKPQLEIEKLSFLYLHLKFMKPFNGLANYDITNPKSGFIEAYDNIKNDLEFISMEKFAKIKPQDFPAYCKYFTTFRHNLFLKIALSPPLQKLSLSLKTPLLTMHLARVFEESIKPILKEWEQTKNLLNQGK